MKMNNKMRGLIESAGNESLPEELCMLLDGGFKAVDGCLFFKGLYELRGKTHPGQFPDATGYECFVNHFHIHMFTEENLPALAMACLRRIRIHWDREASATPIRVIISLTPEDYACTVRFHARRPGEEWAKEDLEEYSKEGVLVADFPEDKLD